MAVIAERVHRHLPGGQIDLSDEVLGLALQVVIDLPGTGRIISLNSVSYSAAVFSVMLSSSHLELAQ